MKKILLLVSIICLYNFSLMGQTKRVTVGINIGPSIDWLSPKTDGYNRDGAIAGLRYGIPVDINLTSDEYYYFVTGVKFSHSGGKFAYLTEDITNNTLYNVHRKYNAIYLSIPTGIKLKTPSFGSFVFAGNFGFEHGFLLSNKTLDYTYIGDQKSKDTRKRTFENGLIFKESLYVGVGAEYTIKDNFRATFFVNYSFTATNFFNKKATNNVSQLREKGNLNAIEFILGVSF